MTVTETAPSTDLSGAVTGIDRYRSLSRYVLTVLAGGVALLAAGTQLSSIGKLTWEDQPYRVVAVVVGLVLAFGAAGVVMQQALSVLRPKLMTLKVILADDELLADVESHPGLLDGAGSVATVEQRLSQKSILSDDERAAWVKTARKINDFATYLKIEQKWTENLTTIGLSALAGIIGIVVFTWGANAPEAKDPPGSPAAVGVQRE